MSMRSNAAKWSPDSWRAKPSLQMPDYPDAKALAEVEAQLASFPPLVFAGEARNLKKALAQVAAGEAFLLQGGDCAESFAEHGANNIRDFFRLFLQMAVVLTYAAASPVVKVGRIAGQFAKPRTSPVEKRGGVELPVYRGDIINGTEFTAEARIPDPRRQIRSLSAVGGNTQSVACVCHRRLRQPAERASMDAVVRQGLAAVEALSGTRRATSPTRSTSCAPAASIRRSHPEMRTTDFFTSHEALLLGYEQAFTRVDSTTGDWYCTSGHMVWIGDRTRQADHAHVEYCRGIKNPLGLKTGPTQKVDELLRLIDILNPDNEPGRLTLICRVGADKAADLLPAFVRAVKREGRNVVWSCDPMHGNTITSVTGYKTRPFDQILKEVRTFFQVHAAEGTMAGGVHLEMTGQNVTECTGGARAISDEDLNDRYHTVCDPRLNAEQSLDLAFLLGRSVEVGARAQGKAAAGRRGAVIQSVSRSLPVAHQTALGLRSATSLMREAAPR